TEAIPTITDFSLFDQSIYAQSDPKYITSSGDIKLNHDENTFTITFAALNFSNPEHAEFDYMLSGVDKDWNRAHNHSNRVTYKNLRPAEYTFLLRAANSSDIFSATVLKQRIVIEPPIWATWYAFLFYFLLLTLAAYVVVQYYSERLKRHEAMEISKMERRKIEELLEMRTLFFTNISHELRTPLTLILSPLQSLMRETQITSNTKWHGYLKTMQHNGNSLLRLINELLSHTKQESGKLKCEKHNGDIEATSRTLFMQFSFWAEQKSITLSFSSEQRPLYIDYDPYLMEQILYNLISNAMKNTPQNGDISFTLEDEGRNIVLSVSNSGAGISDEAKEHIFEHFFSLSSDSSREMGGSGVGLHLTKSLVELHHGEIWFTSQPDQRTTFYVRLPKPSTQQTELRAEASSPVNDSEATAQQQESQLQLSRLYGEDSNTLPSLLIIDDNIEMLKLLEDIFSQSYSITTACDGEQGWQTCLDEMPDIIISDVMMPKLNGLELLKRIKTDNRTSHIPIVLLTAKSGDEDIATGYRTQADGYCCKPFSNDVLLESVNSILRNRKLMATKYNLMQDDESQLESTISNADHLFLKRLSEYIEENIHSPELVVNSLCSYMGVTSLVLNKKLKSLINMTANALIRSIRLKRAATLLKTGRYTIADVTYDVGFSDLRYFRECFKKEFGILPQEYKERYSPPQQES
ncbi:MAG: hybrid sensor histidine kinase/response regulator transcription factor, partial [Rikenellaceae bacterium]